MHARRKAILSFAIIFFWLSGIAREKLLAQQPQDSPKKAKYVSSDVCQGCHEEQYESFAASAHVHTLKREKNNEALGCESCHGPGAAHVEGGGDPEKIQRFAGASPETIQQLCNSCHPTNLGGAHTKARLTCFTCHSVHHYQQLKFILVTSETQLCQRCHNEGIAQSKPHHR
jgi:predicted CXXCH cytochrome family protein